MVFTQEEPIFAFTQKAVWEGSRQHHSESPQAGAGIKCVLGRRALTHFCLSTAECYPAIVKERVCVYAMGELKGCAHFQARQEAVQSSIAFL